MLPLDKGSVTADDLYVVIFSFSLLLKYIAHKKMITIIKYIVPNLQSSVKRRTISLEETKCKKHMLAMCRHLKKTSVRYTHIFYQLSLTYKRTTRKFCVRLNQFCVDSFLT